MIGNKHITPVRQKSKEVSLLLTDDDKLKELRAGRSRERGLDVGDDDEDDDLKRAIAASKRDAERAGAGDARLSIKEY
jgi:hypothetical protein